MGVVTYIGTYALLGAYYLSIYCYKHMRLLTRVYGIVVLKPYTSKETAYISLICALEPPQVKDLPQDVYLACY